MEKERARLIALLDQSEAMLAELASRDDPKLFATLADLQQTVLRLRTQLATLENRTHRTKTNG